MIVAPMRKKLFNPQKFSSFDQLIYITEINKNLKHTSEVNFGIIH